MFSEMFFTAKTYLRSTMTQERLNNIMLMHCHRDKTDALDLTAVANDFKEATEQRIIRHFLAAFELCGCGRTTHYYMHHNTDHDQIMSPVYSHL